MSSKQEEELLTSIICSAGDLLLVAKDESGTAKARYRVSSKELIKCSGYYEKLLVSEFSEGIRFRQESEQLLASYGDNLVKAPLSDLPSLFLPFPVGFTRAEIVVTAFKLFLQCIHQEKLTKVEEKEGDWLLIRLSSDVDLFAHIVAISDQLDASMVIRYVADQILKGQPMCTKKPRKGDQDSERYWRQLLYVAHVQKQSEAFKWISGSMILHGFDTVDNREPDAPWMNLPNHIDEEIAARRDGIFNTILSIPNSLMKPYMQIDKSNSPICKLGWANSPACDSFQLGESVRWLCRRKLTTPNLNMIFATPDGDMAIPEGSPRAMIKILKEFPDYQIDANHRRCGIKGKLIQLLDVVDRMIVRPQQVGLCLDCWYSHEHDYFSWSMEHRPDPAPYKGNIVIDLAAVQSFKDTMKRQQDQVQHDSRQESFESDSTSSLSSTVADSIRTDLHVDTQARLSARISNGRTILYHNFIRPPSLKAHQILQKPGSSNLQCPFVCDHELYAKVFSPEKWTEKEWIPGDEPVEW